MSVDKDLLNLIVVEQIEPVVEQRSAMDRNEAFGDAVSYWPKTGAKASGEQYCLHPLLPQWFIRAILMRLPA